MYVRVVPGAATSTWTLESTLQAPVQSPAHSTDAFGSAVAIDGDHLVVGDNENNRAYVFERQGSTWVVVNLTLKGAVVAINDGILVIGDLYPATVTRVYARDVSSSLAWTSVANVTRSWTEFGRSVATRNGVVVIGSIDEGNVIAVDCDTAACSAGTSLKPPYGISGFGNLVAVDADADGNSGVVVSGVKVGGGGGRQARVVVTGGNKGPVAARGMRKVVAKVVPRPHAAKKPGDANQGKKGGRGKKGPKPTPMTAEQLDAQLDSYKGAAAMQE